MYFLPSQATLTSLSSSFFFFNDTATTEIYTLSLHDALPILFQDDTQRLYQGGFPDAVWTLDYEDRKSTRLNSSHTVISYAVFCLKKNQQSRRRCSIASSSARMDYSASQPPRPVAAITARSSS